MNKSLVLVMCDVLVLSAMSLSIGGFDEDGEKGCQAGQIDVTEEFQSTTNELSVAQGEMSELKDKVRSLEETLKIAKEAVSNANYRATAAITQAKDEMNRQVQDLVARHQSEMSNASHRAEMATAKVNEINGKLNKVSGELEETQRKLVDSKAESERVKRWANEQVTAEKTRSQEAESNANYRADTAIAKAKDEMEKAKAEVVKIKDEAAETVKAVRQQADKRINDLLVCHQTEMSNASRRVDATKAELEETQRELAASERRLEEAVAESKRSVQGNIEAIERALCRVTITTKKGKDEPVFYSPIIDFKGEAYVMVDNYEASRLDMMKSFLVVANNGEEPRTYNEPEAYFLVDGGRKLDIVLLKLQEGECWTNRMTLGQRRTDSSPYWIGRNTGKVIYIRPSINQKEINGMLKTFKRGDLCVDVEERSIVGLYVKKNDKFTFDEPNQQLRKWPFEDEKGRK